MESAPAAARTRTVARMPEKGALRLRGPHGLQSTDNRGAAPKACRLGLGLEGNKDHENGAKQWLEYSEN